MNDKTHVVEDEATEDDTASIEELRKANRLLKEENKLLRKERLKWEANQSYVEITSPHGLLIYAMANEHSYIMCGPNCCFTSDLLDLELWIAGKKVTTFLEIAESNDKTITEARDGNMGGIRIQRRRQEPKSLTIIFEDISSTDIDEKDVVKNVFDDPSPANRKQLEDCPSVLRWEHLDLHDKNAPAEYSSLDRDWRQFVDDDNNTLFQTYGVGGTRKVKGSYYYHK